MRCVVVVVVPESSLVQGQLICCGDQQRVKLMPTDGGTSNLDVPKAPEGKRHFAMT